jgi:hypothetical protein
MVEEISLDERWEKQILINPKRQRAEIKRAALAKTDIRSITEWAHLQRNGVSAEHAAEDSNEDSDENFDE